MVVLKVFAKIIHRSSKSNHMKKIARRLLEKISVRCAKAAAWLGSETIATDICHELLGARVGLLECQNSFATLHRFSLMGMQIGGGSHVGDSGEESSMNYVREKLSKVHSPIIFDVGANIGSYAQMLTKVFGPMAVIHAFEPSRKTFEKLRENTAAVPNVQPHHFGLGCENGTLLLFSDADESGMASVYKRRLDHFGIEMGKSEEIQLRTLDSFCEEAGIERIHLLKMDVEGHELKVLQGASRMLSAGRIDFLQFEFGGCNIDSRTFFQEFFYLLSDRYRLYRVVKNGLHPIAEYREIQEVFITTNFIAERK